MARNILARRPGLPFLLLKGLPSVLVLLLAGAGAAPAQLDFEAPAFYPAGNEPWDITAGDFNRDSIPDLAAALYSQGSVAVLLGVGGGAFASPVFVGVNNNQYDVDCADLRGNGSLDLVFALGLQDGKVGVALGNGDGTFLPPVRYRAGAGSVAQAIADVNGDSIPDLAVADRISSDIAILLGSGDGTFGAATLYTTGANKSPFDVAVGDFNSDGVPDLCAALHNSDQVAILLGAGDGTFGPPQAFSDDNQPGDLGLGDFNRDGNLDVVVTNYGNPGAPTLGVFMGRGDGTLGTVTLYAVLEFPRSLAVTDLFSDGVLDLVVVSTDFDLVSVMLGRGDGTFEPPRSHWAGDYPAAVAVSDLDGDGLLDLAVALSNSDSVAILKGVVEPASEEAGPRAIASTLGLAVAPNPVVARTSIHFELAARSRASLRLLDAGGRVVQRLLDGDFPAGSHRFTWDLATARPERIPAGAYFLVLETGDQRRAQRVAIIR